MGDKDYVKLDPATMGYELRGTVAPPDRSMLVEAFAQARRDMGPRRWAYRMRARKIFWINLWQETDEDEDGRMLELSDRKLAKTLDRWCRDAVARHCEPGAIVDGYAFIVNPKGTLRAQEWHIDSTTDAASLWIPLTPFTKKNATEYVTLPHDTPAPVLERLARHVDEVDMRALRKDVPGLVVRQALAEPMAILHMGRGTIHRGIRNTGDDDRVALMITVHFIKDYERNYPYRSAALRRSEPSVAAF